MSTRKPGIAGKVVMHLAILFCLLSLPALAGASPRESADVRLGNACIGATLRAIGLEIGGYSVKLETVRKGQGNPANIPAYEKRLDELRLESVRFAAMSAEGYKLPEKLRVGVSPSGTLKPGSLLELDDMSRSGPFYHAAGIEGDDWSILEPGKSYSLTIIPVYPRDYILPHATSQYVYILAPDRDGTRESGSEKSELRFSSGPRQTGEEILEGLTAAPGAFSVRVASNGCTDKSSFRVRIEKAGETGAKLPHFILTIHRIRADECKAIVEDGTVLEWDLARDLGIGGECTFSIANRVRNSRSRRF